MPAFGYYVEAYDPTRVPRWRYDPSNGPPKCRTKGCLEKATHVVGYSYVTGRRGNTAEIWKPLCRKHAEVFAKRYEISMGS